uniref:dolichyl-diphosphooligosaccharide--protein glycotransferase n=1 Tax=Bicosoecida sp. CB-2014 TaxID=1486930 RepID=A0A7S1GAA0_9STRA|mmetsp:Transcript_28005/g.96811  ORF Transcript_28005/g.96811 Transcript_28005/m.96811 type:complete len:813 (+) Transcript_28005:182-2620(+)
MVSATSVAAWGVRLFVLYMAANAAYHIRMFAIEGFGRVIHEFDPWFNFRATQYLADHGWDAFFTWFDHMSWYPLGRPVGTTIYPGMQITSVAIWQALEALGMPMSLNDVCVFVPVWFGVLATVFCFFLAWECTDNATAAVTAAAIFAVIPAHIMRSVGGGYDNESVAMTAMLSTFFFWCRSLRTPSSWWIGAVAGIAYFNMVAAWGGYVFVLNMVAAHAAGLVLCGYHSTNLHRAYTLFYVIGTALAIQVPVVGMTPLKSLEQLGAFAVFGLIQLMEIVDIIKRRRKLADEDVFKVRVQVFGAAAALAAAVVAWLWPQGYFGPLSSRIRGLFVQHTRTGNPLVDSVAEHQPASADAYWQYLHAMCYFAPIGFCIALVARNERKLFLTFYAMVAYYFSNRMARLIILIGPIAAILGGYAIGLGIEWGAAQFFGSDAAAADAKGEEGEKGKDDKAKDAAAAATPARGKRQGKGKKGGATEAPSSTKAGKKGKVADLHGFKADHLLRRLGFDDAIVFYYSESGKATRMITAGFFFFAVWFVATRFNQYSQALAYSMSQPSIMFKARLQSGEEIIVDDYREAYWWLRDNTPEDSRVMAWWDYGYQIAGVANRTTIADGNTWNHEHIATLGRALTSPEKEAHRMIRHLADYVLIWTGGGGDDLAKAPHMARIGNSVYHDICPGDPTCRNYGFMDQQMTPTPMMAESLLYKLHSGGQRPGVEVDPNRFREVFTSKYNKVRIYQVMSVSKKSKEWAADPANWVCDRPGSWFCRGQYPPALDKVMSKKKDFKQLEDFNTEDDEEAQKYQEEYHKRMSGMA